MSSRLSSSSKATTTLRSSAQRVESNSLNSIVSKYGRYTGKLYKGVFPQEINKTGTSSLVVGEKVHNKHPIIKTG